MGLGICVYYITLYIGHVFRDGEGWRRKEEILNRGMIAIDTTRIVHMRIAHK